MISQPKFEMLKITELLLNPQNPRFDPVQHQTEVIEAMIEDQKEKLVELAKHISDFGLSPTDSILVQPLEKNWIVREGNRRVTALKLVNEPELIPLKYAKIKKEFLKLNSVFDKSIINNIRCVVLEDEDLINEWIRLKHTGENKGIGTVAWDGQQTGRFSNLIRGKSDTRIAFLDALRVSKEIPETFKQGFSKIKKTNFDRLMNDPDVRKFLGVANNEGEIVLTNSVSPYLLEVLNDLIFNNLSVGEIYHKDDRIKYINNIIDRVERKKVEFKDPVKEMPVAKEPTALNKGILQQSVVPQEQQREKNTENSNIHSYEPKSKNELVPDKDITSQISKPTKSYPVNRKMLVPSQHKLIISHARILKIFNELKTIDCETCPNAVAALFRVFIELSADCYIEEKKITSVNSDSKLSQKIEAVANDMQNNGIMTKNGLRTARQMASSQTQNTSVKTFHSYVHNKDVTPIPNDLRSAWDDLWPFIENLWR